MRPDVSHIGLAVDTGDGGSCRWKRPPLGGRTRLVVIIIILLFFITPKGSTKMPLSRVISDMSKIIATLKSQSRRAVKVVEGTIR